MSNLQIIRVYKKDADGCFHPLKHALSTKVWQDLSLQKEFSVEDVGHPRMKFLKWVDKNTLLINLSGDTEKQSIDENVIFIP